MVLSPSSLPSTGFLVGQIMFFVMFIAVLAIIVTVTVSVFRQSRKDDKSPRLTVPATVVGKRTHHSSGSHTGSMHHSGTTRYYITFQVESGDRMELAVYGDEYGLLVEGDQGELTFQGSRFVSFARY